jgi:hypothetical protein
VKLDAPDSVIKARTPQSPLRKAEKLSFTTAGQVVGIGRSCLLGHQKGISKKKARQLVRMGGQIAAA